MEKTAMAETGKSGTSLASASGSREPLPTPWIERLFSRLEALYGSKFHDLWRGCDLPTVKATWAEKLAGFADMPDCLRLALDACDERPWPPTLPDFLMLCREAARRGGKNQASLPAPQMSREEARLRLAEAKRRAGL